MFDSPHVFEPLRQAGICGLQFAVLLHQWTDNYFGAALLDCECVELSLFALPPPGAQVRRIQAFTAQQGAYGTEVLSGIGLVEN